jgi:hypothetical protein
MSIGLHSGQEGEAVLEGQGFLRRGSTEAAEVVHVRGKRWLALFEVRVCLLLLVM